MVPKTETSKTEFLQTSSHELYADYYDIMSKFHTTSLTACVYILPNSLGVALPQYGPWPCPRSVADTCRPTTSSPTQNTHTHNSLPLSLWVWPNISNWSKMYAVRDKRWGSFSLLPTAGQLRCKFRLWDNIALQKRLAKTYTYTKQHNTSNLWSWYRQFLEEHRDYWQSKNTKTEEMDTYSAEPVPFSKPQT